MSLVVVNFFPTYIIFCSLVFSICLDDWYVEHGITTFFLPMLAENKYSLSIHLYRMATTGWQKEVEVMQVVEHCCGVGVVLC